MTFPLRFLCLLGLLDRSDPFTAGFAREMAR